MLRISLSLIRKELALHILASLSYLELALVVTRPELSIWALWHGTMRYSALLIVAFVA